MATPGTRRDQLRRQQAAAASKQRTVRIVAVAAGLVGVVLVGVLIYALVTSMTSKPPQVPRAEQVTPPIANTDATALVLAQAPPQAPTVTVYLDYQCPNCKIFEDAYGQMLADEAAAGTWTLQNSTLTFLDQNLRNTASSRAAVGAACSAFTEHYAGYSAAVFANQPAQEIPGSEGYSDQLLRVTIPTQLGFTPEELGSFQACYDGRATEDFVAGVEKAAYAAGVTGTPSLAVNGKQIDRSRARDGSPDALKELILANA